MREITCRKASVLLLFIVAAAATAEDTEQAAPEDPQRVPQPVESLGQLETVELPVDLRVNNGTEYKTKPDYNYLPNQTPEARTIQKRSISNIIKLLLGGNVPPNHPLVKNPEAEQKTWSLASNIASSLIGGSGHHGHGGWGPSAADQIQHILNSKAKLIPYTGQVASGLTGIAAVKGDILKQIHSLSTAVIAQAAAEAAAKAVASAAAAHAVTAGVAQGIHQTKYAVNKAVKHAKANTGFVSSGGWNRPAPHFGGGWNDYQQAFYSTFQNSYAPAPSGKAPGDLPGPPYGRDSNAAVVAAPQASQYHTSSVLGGALGGLLNAASQTFSQSQAAPQQQQSQSQAYDLYSSFNNNGNNNAPESRSELYNTLPSYQQDAQQQQWGGLFGQQQQSQQKPGSSFLNMFQGGFPSGSTKVQASASVSGRNAQESPPSILTSLATLLSASASAYQAINKLSSSPGSIGITNDPTAREDTAVPPTAAAASPSFQGFSSSPAFQQSGQGPTAASSSSVSAGLSRGFSQGVPSSRYQSSGSSSQSISQTQGNSLSTAGSSTVPAYSMAPQFNPSNFNSQASPASFNSPSSSFSSRPQSSSAYQYNAQASGDSHYAQSISRAQNGFSSGGFQQQRPTNNGYGYSGYPGRTGQSLGHASGSSVVPTNYWGNGGNPNTASSRNFETVSGNGNSRSSAGNFASPPGAFAASSQSPSKQIYGFGGQTSQNFAQTGTAQQRSYQAPIQNYGNRPSFPSQGYSGHTNQPLNNFINSRYDFIAQSASQNNNKFTRRYELPSQPNQNQQIHSHQQYNNGFDNNRMPMISNKPGGGFTIPLTNEPVSFTLTIPNNGRQATILQERKGNLVQVSEKRSSEPTLEEVGNTGEVHSNTMSNDRHTSSNYEKPHPFSKESNSWEENAAEKKSFHNNNKERIDYIYSREVSESYESPDVNRKPSEEESREIKTSNSHETITTFLPKRKTPRLSPEDFKSLLVDEEEPESHGRVTQNSSPDTFNLYNEEFAKKVSSAANNRKPKKDWDTLRREARAKSLSALVQRLMGVQD